MYKYEEPRYIRVRVVLYVAGWVNALLYVRSRCVSGSGGGKRVPGNQ